MGDYSTILSIFDPCHFHDHAHCTLNHHNLHKYHDGDDHHKSISAPELPALERRNWLIHLHYVRREYEVIIIIIFIIVLNIIIIITIIIIIIIRGILVQLVMLVSRGH